jgi:hypothetical protein
MGELQKALANTIVLGWIALGLLGGWVIGIVLTHLFLRVLYPPNAARLGCWLGITAWLVFAVLFVLGYVASVALPTWLLVGLACVVLFIGLLVWMGRRQAA